MDAVSDLAENLRDLVFDYQVSEDLKTASGRSAYMVNSSRSKR